MHLSTYPTENAVDSVLRMGSRNQSLEYVAFNDNTIYNKTSKLPWKLESQAYKFSSDKSIYGKDKLTRVLTLIRKARHVAHSRAIDSSYRHKQACKVHQLARTLQRW